MVARDVVRVATTSAAIAGEGVPAIIPYMPSLECQGRPFGVSVHEFISLRAGAFWFTQQEGAPPAATLDRARDGRAPPFVRSDSR